MVHRLFYASGRYDSIWINEIAEFLSFGLRVMSFEPWTHCSPPTSHFSLPVTQSRRRCKPYDPTTPKYTPKGGIQGWGRANNGELVFFEASLSLRKTTSPRDYKSVEAITHCLVDLLSLSLRKKSKVEIVYCPLSHVFCLKKWTKVDKSGQNGKVSFFDSLSLQNR